MRDCAIKKSGDLMNASPVSSSTDDMHSWIEVATLTVERAVTAKKHITSTNANLIDVRTESPRPLTLVQAEDSAVVTVDRPWSVIPVVWAVVNDLPAWPPICCRL